MPFTPRKEEVATMAEAIRGCQSLEEVAKTALKEAFKTIQGRSLWYVAVKESRLVYGPFASETDAYNALGANKLKGFTDEEGIKAIRKEGIIPSLGGKALVFQGVGPLVAFENARQYDWEAYCASEHLCLTCGHGAMKHNVNGRSDGCSLCECSKLKPAK